MIIRPLLSLLLLLLVCNGYAQIHTLSFAPKIDFVSGGNPSNPGAVAAADFDGDGKPDVASLNSGNNTLCVSRNISTLGSIGVTIQTQLTYNTGTGGIDVKAEDMDGDGKPDMVVSNYSSSDISVFRNTSVSGSISFATRTDYAVSLNGAQLLLFDFDSDGKKDVVVGNFGNNLFSVFRNTSVSGSITFATRQDFAGTGSGSAVRELAASDFDGDGKTDLAALYYNGFIGIFRNSSVSGTISFATPVNLTAVNLNCGISAGDIDGDNKPDLVVSHNTNSAVLAFKNNSSIGSISFAAYVSFATGTAPHFNQIIDLDNDNKPEIVVGNRNSATISVLRNITTTGTINTSSFAAKVDFTTGSQPMSFAFADMDSDGKKDLISPNYLSHNFSILRNQVVTGLIGHYPLNGNGNDLGPYALNATVSSGASAAASRYGSANASMQFDGTANARILSPNSPAFSIANMPGVSVSLWMKPDNATPLPANRIIYLFNDGTRTSELFFNYSSKRLIVSNWNGAASPYFITPSKTFLSNTWYHIVVTIDSLSSASQRLKLYVNDTLLHSQLVTMTKPNASSFQLSKHHINDWNFTGGIDDVRIYNVAIAAADVHNLYQVDRSAAYYSKATGSLNQLATWGSNPDGTGNSPLSFDSSDVTYYVHNNPGPAVSGTLKISGARSTLVLGDGTNAFNLAVSPSDTLFCDSVYINRSITVTAQGSFETPRLGSAETSAVQYLGTGLQNMAAGAYYNLVVSGGLKTLTGNTSVKNIFGMLAPVNNPSYQFVLGTDATNTGSLSHSAGTIYGSFSRWFASAANSGSSGLFPVGNSTRFAPASFSFTSAPAAGGVITSQFVAANPGSMGLPVFDIAGGFIFVDKAAIDGYWKVTSTISTGTVTAALTANDFTGVSNFQNLRLMTRNTGGSWVLPGSAVANMGSNGSFTVIRSGITSLAGEYGIGGDQSQNPLPVKLVSFTALLNEKEEAALKWTTAYEAGNRLFEIQRSTDNTSFAPVAQVKGQGTSLIAHTYTHTDDLSQAKGKGARAVFYRLKQVDTDGKFTYSKTVRIALTPDLQNELTIYPNPAGNSITVNHLQQPAAVYDLLGNHVMTIGENGTTDISSLKSGIYIIRSGTATQKLVKE